MTKGRTLIRPEWTTLPPGDVTAGEWEGVRDDVQEVKLSRTYTNLRTLGLSLDGTTDETVAFQEAIDNAAPGTILVMDENAKIRISDQIVWSNKRLTIQGFGDAEIICTEVLDKPIVYIDSAHGGTFSGIDITGAETEFVGTISPDMYGLTVANSEDFTLEDSAVRHVSRGFRVFNSPRPTIDGLRFFGMVNSLYLNVNYHTTLTVTSGSHGAKISRIHGENCGSALLVGTGCSRGIATMITGYNTYDNGVYISSGDDWQVIAPHFEIEESYNGDSGTGVKMRGSRHTLLGGNFFRMGTGVIISGYGGDLGDGSNGYGTRVIGAMAHQCRQIAFNVASHGGFKTRDATMAHCTAVATGDLADAATMGAFRATSGTGLTFAYNTVRNSQVTTYAMRFGGGGYGMERLRLIGNVIQNPISQGITLNDVVDAEIQDTRIENISGNFGIHLSGCSNSQVTGTRATGTRGAAGDIRVSGAGAVPNRIIDNPYATVSNVASGTIVSGNDGSVTANAPVSGSRGGNAALSSLLSQLHALGIIRDTSTS